jgi:hypothetical protein
MEQLAGNFAKPVANVTGLLSAWEVGAFAFGGLGQITRNRWSS